MSSLIQKSLKPISTQNYQGLLRRVRQKVLQLPSEFRYRTELLKYASHLPKLSASEHSIVNTLRSEGAYVTSLAALSLPSTAQLLQAACGLFQELEANRVTRRGRHSVYATPEQISHYPELFLAGLDQQLLNIVETYIGVPVAYLGVSCRREVANGREVATRLWHQDLEDRRMIRIIVYLNEVDQEGGPFEYIAKNSIAPVQWLKYHSHRLHKASVDRAVKSVVPRQDWKACVGPAGTVVFADTGSIFHRGRLPVASERKALFFTYTSRQPLNLTYAKQLLSQEQLLTLTQSLGQRQRDCVFWQG
ncbi:2OG-Fe(II) oxygenase [Leptolyngbya sp. FACHB-261]|uniref:2OG-Fe(II) oxygenase n=1 Tax=Leptolyngbya sp. FACHB-261 TaxID=2692806 RepID=UPI0016884376|nr:2OG-Fe(II) oxygenase [Leptolyngbya sp. FACHB-261]MBD2103574.1 2OG-Fe(II) oxygenase [Leptolyngbya sp. FACHB-261]